MQPGPDLTCDCITCPLQPQGGSCRIYANLDAASQHGELSVELLYEQFRPIEGYSGEACRPLKASGLRQAVTWKGKDNMVSVTRPFRLRLTFGGVRPEDIRLYAIYVAQN